MSKWDWNAIRIMIYLTVTAGAFGVWQHSFAAGLTFWGTIFTYMVIWEQVHS